MALRARLARLTGLPSRADGGVGATPVETVETVDSNDLPAQLAALRASASAARLSPKTRAQGQREWEQLLTQLVRHVTVMQHSCHTDAARI